MKGDLPTTASKLFTSRNMTFDEKVSFKDISSSKKDLA